MAFNCPEKSPRSNLKYDFNWLLFLNDMLPIIRRKVRIFSYLAVPFKEMQNLYTGFLSTRCSTLFQTAFNGQSIVLERYLNMLFDNIDRGIVIENVISNFQTMYVYKSGETPPVGDESYIYKEDEVIPPSGDQEYIFRKDQVEFVVDFLVKIPEARYSVLNIGQVEAVVELYKAAGTTFRVISY